MKYYDADGKPIKREAFVKIYAEKYFNDYNKNQKELEDDIQEKYESGTRSKAITYTFLYRLSHAHKMSHVI